MSTIVAIGWWENGRPGTKRETKSIDQYIVSLTHTVVPNFLFVPTASSDHLGYVSHMQNMYAWLGCTCDSLLLQEWDLSPNQIQAKIERADIIYVGGGDTQHMMTLRKKHSVDQLLLDAYASSDKVLCWLSAGSICWFAAGQSDSEKFGQDEDGKRKYIEVKGLGILPAIHAPHFDKEAERKTSRPQFVKDFGGIGIGMDNCCALVSESDKFKIIRSAPDANAYKCFWKGGVYVEEVLPQEVWIKR